MSNWFMGSGKLGSGLFLGGLAGGGGNGSQPSIDTKTVTDPTKTAVANPLASYLANQVGQGIPTYTGQQGASVSPFLSKSVDQIYQDYAAPATKQFTDVLLPQIREGYAGALSSSGRDIGEGTAAANFELGLAETKAGLETSVPQAQQAIEGQQYQQWYQGLAQNNPALGSALQFLNNSTSDGSTLLAALNPGQQSILPSLIGAAATIGGAIIGGPAAAPAGAGVGNAFSNSLSSPLPTMGNSNLNLSQSGVTSNNILLGGVR